MHEWLMTVLLGVVEGLTEFIPVSSTAHLIFVQYFFQDNRSELFDVGIQSGAILAVVLIYWQRLLDFVLKMRENLDYILKLGAAFVITSVTSLTAVKLGFELEKTSIFAVASATLVGAFFIFWLESLVHRLKPSDEITWAQAVVVGLAQTLAGPLCPGTSRSGATIISAMFMGCSRAAATEFSFLLCIPTLFAASAWEMLKDFKTHGMISGHELEHLALGFLVSLVVGFAVVKWLLVYIRTHTFIPFAWYRLILGMALFAWMWLQHMKVT